MTKLLRKLFVCAALIGLYANSAKAQLSSNPDKFLGNITTGWASNMDTDGFIFSEYWNQVTPENATKWGSVEGNRGRYSWQGADVAAKYAKEHGFPFKFHTLVWGSQFPDWLRRLSPEERFEAIVNWMDAAKEHFPDLQMIDVVNEAISGHQPDTPLIKEALGGDGKTGYDWIIKAFEMAHERWPDAILIYNDFNTFQWNTDQYIDIVKTLRDAGAPIDAYGCQSHDLTDCSLSNFKKSLTKLQDALKMPMYITEYDIDLADDNKQLKQFQDQLPLMWEADYCAGITLWGWIHGKTWVSNSGLIKNGKERPAMTWLREYMQTDAAKNAKSPFPGMVKEASIYVKAGAFGVEKGQTVPISVDIRLKTKTLDNVELFVNGEKNSSLFAECIVLEPGARNLFEAEYTPEEEGTYDIKVVVKTTDGTTYERHSGFNVYAPREPFNGEKEIPGIIEAEDFDKGVEGVTFHDSDNVNEGDNKNYRTDAGGVDLVNGNGGCAIGYTATGEWLEYTVNVKEAGDFTYDATVSCGSSSSSFEIGLVKENSITTLAKVNVPQIAENDWNTYKVISGNLSVPLEAGKQILRITITAPYVNLDKIELKQAGTGIQSVENQADADGQNLYNLYGMKVGKNYKGIMINNGKKVLNK